MKKTKKAIIVVFAILIIGIVAFQIISTNAKYVTEVSGGSTADVATWSVKINGEDYSEGANDLELDLTLVANSLIANDYIAPGGQAYFDVEIDVSDSLVAAEYTIELGDATESVLTVIGYSTAANLVGLSGTTPAIEEDTIEGGWNSPTGSRKIAYRVFVEWKDIGEDEMDTDVGINELSISIPVVITVNQRMVEVI